jgi:hypothetical protein
MNFNQYLTSHGGKIYILFFSIVFFKKVYKNTVDCLRISKGETCSLDENRFAQAIDNPTFPKDKDRTSVSQKRAYDEGSQIQRLEKNILSPNK